MRLRPSGFPVHPHWAGGAAPTEAGLLRDPWQNARWQHAIFLKVNNKTTAVSHLEKPGRPQGWEGSRRVPGAGPALLQSSTFLPGTDQWLSFPQPAMGASLPQQGSQMPAARSSWPCLVDPTARHPSPSICLFRSKQYQSHWCPAAGNLPNGGYREQTVPALPPHSGVCALKITKVAAQRSEREAPPPLCTFTGQPKRLPGTPHSVSSRTSPRS